MALPTWGQSSPWCEWMIFQFSSQNVPKLKLKCNRSDSPFLLILLPSGINETHLCLQLFESVLGLVYWAVLHAASSFLCVPWLPFNWKCTQQKHFSFDFSCAGLNLHSEKHCGEEGNANEGKIKLGAQCRWTVLPYVLYLAELVILFIMPSIYSPEFPQIAPQGQSVRGCEWRICEVVWMRLLSTEMRQRCFRPMGNQSHQLLILRFCTFSSSFHHHHHHHHQHFFFCKSAFSYFNQQFSLFFHLGLHFFC